jgi:hypothetical protein
VWDVRLSPDGHRFAWLTEVEAEVWTRPSTYRIWTSDLNGQDVTEVGCMLAEMESSEASATGERNYFPQNLEWLPDGRSLSFTFKNALWTVPVGEA